MGKKYYGGIGTDKGFVMHSPENKYHYSRDDEFHKEGDKRDVGSTSNTGGGNSNSIGGGATAEFLSLSLTHSNRK